MAHREPAVHQQIWLETDRAKQKRLYKSNVLDMDGDRILVAMPAESAQWVLLEQGMQLSVLYTADDSMYTIPAVVHSRQLEPPASLTLIRTGATKRIQRRDFVRMDLSLPVKYQKQSNKPRTGNLRIAPSTRTTWIKDLSGGGVQLIVNEEMKQGDLLELEFVLGQLTVKIMGKVIRFRKGDEEAEEPDTVGVQFMDITESLRDKIIRFIFREQMRRRREGRE